MLTPSSFCKLCAIYFLLFINAAKVSYIDISHICGKPGNIYKAAVKRVLEAFGHILMNIFFFCFCFVGHHKISPGLKHLLRILHCTALPKSAKLNCPLLQAAMQISNITVPLHHSQQEKITEMCANVLPRVQ